MPDPVPRKDSELLTWSRALCDGISLYAAELNIPPDQVAELLARREVFRAAYFRAYSPARSMADTRAKNDARKDFLRVARPLARMTYYSATSTQRIKMGLKPRRRGKAPPLPRAVTAPMLAIKSVVGRRLNLHISDRMGRAKPHGVDCAVIFWSAGENPAPNLGRRGLPIMASRRTCVIEIPGKLPPGTKIWVIAQWMNGRKERGPFCQPVYDYVGGGLGRIGGLKKAA